MECQLLDVAGLLTAASVGTGTCYYSVGMDAGVSLLRKRQLVSVAASLVGAHQEKIWSAL
eukprot:1157264-Pelagomonas_calceolata.AAC.3